MLLKIFRHFAKDPISAYTHFIGVLLSIAGTVYMILKAERLGDPSYVISSAIFGASMLLLYSASTIYHSVKKSGKIQGVLRRVDHTMIYVLIAGTYTPLCLSVLKGNLGLGLLIGIWSLAALGIVIKILWLEAPRWLYTGFYLALGWIGMIFIWPIFNALPLGGFLTLVIGGLLYTAGSVIYAQKIEFFSFKNFGHHEIFHLFILGGTFSHFIMVNTFIL